MIDKFLRESDFVNHLNNFTYSQLLLIFYFKPLIYGNCGFILVFYVSRLSLRSKFNHSYVHCRIAFISCSPSSLSSFPDRSFKSFSFRGGHGSTLSSSSSSAAAATTSTMAKNNNNNKNKDKNNDERQRQRQSAGGEREEEEGG